MLTIHPLRAADIPLALRLSTQAGWNQIGADWERLLHLWPETCLAGWLEGQLIATATLATYGAALGWVGMVLVDEQHRGRGFGGAIFDAVIECGVQRGIGQLALDASDEGRPVYLKRGFVDVAPISRWIGTARHVPSPPPQRLAIHEAQPADWRELLEADAAASGADRSALLRRLAAEPGALVLVARDNERLAGAGFARLGRTAAFLGPVWAEYPAAASAIAGALLERLRRTLGPCPVMADLPGGSCLEETLLQHGFEPQRRLTRMIRHLKDPSPPLLCGPHLPAAAGFELG